LGNVGECSFPRVFGRKDKISLFREIFIRNLRDLFKKRSCKWAALSTGALLEKLEGVRLLGLLREKENADLGAFSWTQRTLKVKSGCHLEL
jgi:hypothetical protein